MKHIISTIFGLVFVVSALSGALAAPPPGLAKYQAARAEFDRMVADAEEGKGEMPRLSDPRAAEILRTLSDVDDILGTQTYEWSDYSTLSGMCLMNTPVRSYSFLGAKPYPPKGSKQDDEVRERENKERRKIIDRNLVTYQDEVALLSEFSLACRLRLIPLVEELAVRLDQRGGFPWGIERNMHQRIMIFKATSLGLFSRYALEANAEDSKIRPENARRLLKVGAGVADQYAGIFNEKQRSEIIEKAQELRPTLEPAAQADLDTVIRAMQRTECEGLCVLQW